MTGHPPIAAPLRLTAPVAPHVFGGRALADRLGREGLPDGRVGETWEVSDVSGMLSEVVDGPWAGTTLRDLTAAHPDEVVGRGWRGPAFPLLTKFIDAAGMLPVHLHADDATARRLECAPHGKTEAWHILDAAPGATALCGVVEGVGPDRLREALLAQDFDAVMRRLPVRAGETVYVPGGTLHSFGPDTLVYEIEQTSDLQQHAMGWQMEDGSRIDDEQRHANIEALLAEWDPVPRPEFRPGLAAAHDDGVTRVVLCAGPFSALDRWRVGSPTGWRHRFDTAQIVSNVGAPARLRWSGGEQTLGRATSLLLPAALGEVVVDGPVDLLVGYLPDLERDVGAPLLAAGHGAGAIATLGEGLDDA